MTGLEPATSGVTGRCSNQLSYIPSAFPGKAYGDPSGIPIGSVASLPSWRSTKSIVLASCRCFKCSGVAHENGRSPKNSSLAGKWHNRFSGRPAAIHCSRWRLCSAERV